MIRELLNMLREAIRLDCLERIRDGIDVLESGNHASVEQPAAHGQQPVVGHVTEPVMGEIKSLADAVKDVRAHQRLDGGGGIRFPEVGRPLQQSKFKVAADHGRRREQMLTRVAQSLKPAENQLSNLRGQCREIGKGGMSRSGEYLAQTLDDYEGVS